MQIIRADVLGMCFGVRDALGVIDSIDQPSRVTIHGQLVHNEVVLHDLQARGFILADETERASALPNTPLVLITAHGVSDRERRRLEAGGKLLVDTTCPLVRRAHQAAQALDRDGYHVLVIGRRNHVEVRGIVEDLSSYDIIESIDDVIPYRATRLGVIAQTTMTVSFVDHVRQAINARNSDAEVRYIDTICHPTKDHQRALDRLLDQVDAVVVVGGSQSNNTRALSTRCRERGRAVFQVAAASELDRDSLKGYGRIGLTAGTSTLERTIREVEEVLRSMAEEASDATDQGCDGDGQGG